MGTISITARAMGLGVALWGLGVGAGTGSAEAAYREPVQGGAGVVAADHELASQAGVEILRAGGNAVDAAVATALTLGVVQPAGSGLGGGGFLVVRKADGTVKVLDFREMAPQKARPDMFVDPASGRAVPERSRIGGLAVGVPGEPAGLGMALSELGTLPAAQVVGPALRLAREGFPVGKHLARTAASVVPRLAPQNALRDMLAPLGTPLVRGQILRRPELATTLETLGRDGFASFYRTEPGAIGEAIVKAVSSTGGVMTVEDMRAYKVEARAPLEGKYRGWKLYTAPPPAGGITAIEVLQILDARPPFAEGSGASATLHEIIEAFKHAFADRTRYHGDPAFDSVPLTELVSPAYAAGRAAVIKADGVLDAKLYGRPEAGAAGSEPRDHGTSHLCAIDKNGNVAALTTTVNLGFGAHLVAGKTGVLLNNQMDDFAAQPNKPNAFGLVGRGVNAVAAGKRPASSMAPLIAVAPDGRVLCVGGSGGPTIVTGVVQTIINVIDFDKSIEAAIAAPRVHAQFIPDNVLIEPDHPADVRAALKARGHKLVVTPAPLETAVQAALYRPARKSQPVTAPTPPPASGAPPSPAVKAASEMVADPLLVLPFSGSSDPRKGGTAATP